MRLENFQREDLDYLFSVTYEELKRLASSIRAGSATLNPTALVNEAWIKLSRSPKFSADSPLHFKRIAARAMRQVLVDAARRRASEKRAGGAQFVIFDEATDIAAKERDLLGLDAALDELAKVAPRHDRPRLALRSRVAGPEGPRVIPWTRIAGSESGLCLTRRPSFRAINGGPILSAPAAEIRRWLTMSWACSRRIPAARRSSMPASNNWPQTCSGCRRVRRSRRSAPIGSRGCWAKAGWAPFFSPSASILEIRSRSKCCGMRTCRRRACAVLPPNSEHWLN